MSSDDVSHDEAMSQFCGVTGASEEIAQSLLEACNWNLDMAISMHLDTTSEDQAARSNATASTGGLPGPSRPRFNIHNDNNSSSSADPLNVDANGSNSRWRQSPPMSQPDDEIRPPIAPIRQVLINSPISYVPDQRRYNTRGASAGPYDAFRDFEAEARWQEQAFQRSGEPGSVGIGGASGGASGSDIDQQFGGLNSGASGNGASSRATTIEDLFRPPLDLMFRGDFVSARDKSTAENKWLLVNIQNGREFPCQTLNRDVWSDQIVKDIVKEHFIFWQVYHDTHEGGKFVQFYRVGSQPYVSIIDPRTGESMKTWTASTLDKTTFCDSIIEFLTDHPTPDADTIIKKNIHVQPKKEIINIDDDDEIEVQERRVVQIEEHEDTESNDDEMESHDENEDNDEMKADEKSSSSPLLVEENNEEKDDTCRIVNDGLERTCRIALRFPDGTNKIQKFSPQHRLSHIRDFVQSQFQNPLRHRRIKFVVPPHKKLSKAHMEETLESLGLTPACRLEVILKTK